MDMHQARPGLDDLKLRQNQVIRIYDIVFDYGNLLGTDRFYRALCRGPAFQTTMGTAEFHALCGRYVAAHEDEQGGGKHRSLLAAAYRCGVPIFTSSPGDSSIGMNLAALQLEGSELRIDPLRDVNQSAAIVWNAKKAGRSAVLILGGGSPKNFILQTEPQIQEVLGLDESGHDYFLQFTDARPDTGGLSGATPQEAMTWGKVDPDQLPDTVTCYLDSTVALPLLVVYALATHEPRQPRRLLEQLDSLENQLKAAYRAERKHTE
jgi:deoxyhypusine synthase